MPGRQCRSVTARTRVKWLLAVPQSQEEFMWHTGDALLTKKLCCSSGWLSVVLSWHWGRCPGDKSSTPHVAMARACMLQDRSFSPPSSWTGSSIKGPSLWSMCFLTSRFLQNALILCSLVSCGLITDVRDSYVMPVLQGCAHISGHICPQWPVEDKWHLVRIQASRVKIWGCFLFRVQEVYYNSCFLSCYSCISTCRYMSTLLAWLRVEIGKG